tara:strand:- start:5586 stop:16097 length:10512 start_codon:yes stop_codon:yes gene_type:complete
MADSDNNYLTDPLASTAQGDADSYGIADPAKSSEISATKAKQVMAKSLQKQEKFLANNDIPVTEEEFLRLNPDATPEQKQQWEQDLNIALLEDNVYRAEERELAYGDREGGEVAQDITGGVAKGVVNTGGMAYSLMDIASKYNPVALGGNLALEAMDSDMRIPGLDETLRDIGIAPDFQQTREFIEGLQSDELQAERGSVSARDVLFDAESEQRIQDQVAAGEDELLVRVFEQGKAAVDKLKRARYEGYTLTDTVAESVVDLLGGGVVGKAAAKSAFGRATKDMTVEQTKDFMATKAGKELATRAAARAGVGYSAFSEGMSNALQSKEEVLGLKKEEIEKSPDYQEYIKQGMTPQEARLEVANDTFNTVGIITALSAGAISKVTGAGKFVGNILRGNSIEAVGKAMMFKVVKDGATEGIEETLQGLTGQLAQNIGTATHVDTDQDLLEGSGRAAAQGALAGAATGAAVSTPASAAGAASQNTKAAKTGAEAVAKSSPAQKIKKTVQEKTKNSRQKRYTKKVADSVNAFEAEESIKVATDTNNTLEQREEALSEATNKALDLGKEIKADKAQLEQLQKDPETNKDQISSLSSSIEKKESTQARLYDTISGVNEGIKYERNPELKNPETVLSDENASPELKEAASKEVVLGTSFDGSQDSIDSLQKIQENNSLPRDVRRAAARHLKTNRDVQAALQQAETQSNAPDTDKVSSEIIGGNARSESQIDRIRSVGQALLKGDIDTAKLKSKQFMDFYDRHKQKRAVFKAAARAFEAGNLDEVRRLEKQWQAIPGNQNFKFLGQTASNGKQVNPFGGRMEANFDREAELLESQKASLDSMAEGRVDVPASQEPSVAESETPTQEQPQEDAPANSVKVKNTQGKEETLVVNDDGSVTDLEGKVPTSQKLINRARVKFHAKRRNLQKAVIRVNGKDKTYFKLPDGSYISDTGVAAKSDNTINKLDEAFELAAPSEGLQPVAQEAESENAAETQESPLLDRVFTWAQKGGNRKAAFATATLFNTEDENTTVQSSLEEYLNAYLPDASVSVELDSDNQINVIVARADGFMLDSALDAFSKNVLPNIVSDSAKLAYGVSAISVDQTGLDDIQSTAKHNQDVVLNRVEGQKKGKRKINYEGNPDTQTLASMDDADKQFMEDQVIPELQKGGKASRILPEMQKYFPSKEAVKDAYQRYVNSVRNRFMQVSWKTWNKPFKAMTLERINTDSETSYFESVDSFVNNFVNNLDSLIRKDQDIIFNPENKEFSPLDLLTNLDGSLDRPAAEKLGLAFYEWSVTQGKSTLHNDEAAILGILHKDADSDTLTDREYALYSGIGMPLGLVADSVGSVAMRRMGVKIAPDAAAVTESALAQQLGMIAVAANTGGKGFYELRDVEIQPEGSDTAIRQKFIKLKTDIDDSGATVPVIGFDVTFPESSHAVHSQAYAEVVGDKDQVILPLLEADPNWDKPDEGNTPIRKTIQTVAPEQQNMVNKMNKNRLTLNPVSGIFFDMSEQTQKVLGGLVSEEEMAAMRPEEENAARANNNTIEKTLTNFEAFRQKLAESGKSVFYIPNRVWSTLRIGRVGSLDPQNNKMVRHLVANESWKADINTADPVQTSFFKLAVIEAMGGKPKRMQTVADIDNAFDSIVNDLDKEGIFDIVSNWEGTGEISPEDEQAIIRAVKKGEEKLWSLDAIFAVSAYQDAKRNSGNFTTHLFREVDGTNNGVMLSLMSVPGSSMNQRFELLKQGGFFREGSYTNMLEYSSESTNNDAYEDIVIAMLDSLNKQYTPQQLNQMKAEEEALRSKNKRREADEIYFASQRFNLQRTLSRLVTGKFKGSEEVLKERLQFGSHLDPDGNVTSDARNIAKNPLMTMIFGQGEKAIKDKVANAVLQQNLELMNELFQSISPESSREHKETVKAQMGLVMHDMYAVMDYSNENVPRPSSQEEAIKFYDYFRGKYLTEGKASKWYLKEFAQKQFNRNFAGTYGGALIEGMKAKYGDFMETRKTVNGIYGFAHKVYLHAVQNRINEIEQEKGRGISNAEIDGVLKEFLELAPTAENPFEDAEKRANSYEHRQLLSKLKTRYVSKDYISDSLKQSSLVPTNNLQAVRVNLVSPLTQISQDTSGSLKDTTTKNVQSGVRVRTLEEPGVKGGIANIHQLDAAIMMKVMDQLSALNIHDAAAFNVLQTNEGAEMLNRATAEVLNDFSIGNGLANLMANVREYIQSNGLESESFETEYRDGEQVDISGTESLANHGAKLAEYLQSEESLESVREQIFAYDQYASFANQSADMGTGTHFTGKTSDVEVVLEEGITKQQLDQVDGDILGSNNSGVDPVAFGPSATNVSSLASTADTTLRTFDMLEQTQAHRDSVDHTSHLRGVIEGIVNKVVQPFSLMISDDGSTIAGEFNLTSGNIRIQRAISSPIESLRMSAQEAFTHELVHKVTAAGINSDRTAARRLRRLFDVVKEKGNIQPEDFMSRDSQNNLVDSTGALIDPVSTPSAWEAEYSAAKSRMDYVFNNRRRIQSTTEYSGFNATHSRSAMLHEFMAFGLTNASFMAKLKTIPVDDKELSTNQSNNIFARIADIFNRIMDTLFDRAPQNGDAQQILTELAVELSATQNRAQSRITQQVGAFNDKVGKQIADFIVKPIQNWGNTATEDSSELGTVRTGVNALKKATKVSPDGYREVMRRMTSRYGQVKENWLKQVSDELTGPANRFNRLHSVTRLVKTHLDHGRKEVENNVVKVMRDLFPQATREDRIALGRTVMMTDISTSIEDGSMTVSQVVSMLNSESLLDSEIDNTLRALRALSVQGNDTRAFNWYSKLAKSLGHFQATGKPLERGHFAQNASLIAAMAGNPVLEAPSPATVNQARVLIDKLASLHALKFTDTPSKQRAYEMASQNPEGFNFVIGAHAATQAEVLERNFDGQIGLMFKGYIPNRVNPNKEYKVATEQELELMEQRGYKNLGALPKDSLDSGEKLYSMHSNYSREYALDSGMVSLSRDSAKGTAILQTQENRADPDKMKAAQAKFNNIKAAKEAQMRAIMNDSNSEITNLETALIPTTDSAGNIVDYRYVMNHQSKRELLQWDESFDQVMAGLEIGMLNMEQTRKANVAAVNEGRKEFNENFHKDPQNYILIGPASTDPISRETWNSLPSEMKSEIFRVWGRNGMYVHRDVWKTFFGQRQIGVGQLEYKDITGLEGLDKANAVVNNLATRILNSDKGIALERNWQDFVKIAKDNIVIRGIEVMVGNLMSNYVTLMMHGISPVNAYKWQVEALEAAKRYQEDTAEIAQLQFRMQASEQVANDPAVQNRLLLLEESIANNKVTPLFEAGVYQSITEDVYTLNGETNFRSNLEEKFEPIIERIPLRARTMISHATLQHGTPVYGFLNDMTQLGDFMARYALHQHNMQQGEMTFEESVEDIVETFINYDTPTLPLLQYANDMGLVMFTKFWLRNQRVLVKTARKHPVGALGLTVLAGGIGWDTIYDSLIFDGRSLNSPLEVAEGALTNHPLWYLMSSLWSG